MPLEVLCLVMAPLIMRPPSSADDSSSGDVAQRLQKETNFLKTLILHLPIEEEEQSLKIDAANILFDV